MTQRQRLIVRPEQLDLDTPGRRDYWVALEHDHLWADHLVPLTVWVGPEAKPGQGIVATGANHGNEYEGPMAIKHLLGEIRLDDVRGRVILIPVLNPAAFRVNARASVADDGVNLNRAFVDGAGIHPALAGITHRIARFFREYIWPRVHVALDLHSGGLVSALASCSSYHHVADPKLAAVIHETAEGFGTPLIMTYQDGTPGLLPSEGERLGKIMVGTELGYGQSADPVGIRRGRYGILNAARMHGQLAGDPEPIDHQKDGTQKTVSIAERENVTVAPFSGRYEPLYPLEAEVEKGQLLGYLHDFERIDEPAWEVRAGVTGLLMSQAWQCQVQQGQHIAIVARVIRE